MLLQDVIVRRAPSHEVCAIAPSDRCEEGYSNMLALWLEGFWYHCDWQHVSNGNLVVPVHIKPQAFFVAPFIP